MERISFDSRVSTTVIADGIAFVVSTIGTASRLTFAVVVSFFEQLDNITGKSNQTNLFFRYVIG
jgi:hypothetical protein